MKLKSLIVIVVLLVLTSYLLLYQKGELSKKQSPSLTNSCANTSSLAQKQQCWEEQVEKTLKQEGLDSAFSLVDYLYKVEPQFAADCHNYTHLLGEKAYQLFTQNQKINLSSKATYCGFGFYHAFMEKLLHSSGDVTQARKFCDDVVEKSGQSQLSKLSCFHGIGHGLLEDAPNPHLIGDDKAIIKAPLSVCENVGATEEEKRRCASGVFNVIALYYANPSSGLRAKDDEPYLICQSPKERYFQDPCYDQMNTYVLFKLNQGDLIKSAKFAENIKQDDMAQSAMHGLAGAYGQSNVSKVNYDEVISICKTIQPRLKEMCLEGFLMGLFEGGQPDIEYEEGIKFCGSNMLNKEEKDQCFYLLTKYMAVVYEKGLLKKVCERLKQNYQYRCNITW